MYPKTKTLIKPLSMELNNSNIIWNTVGNQIYATMNVTCPHCEGLSVFQQSYKIKKGKNNATSHQNVIKGMAFNQLKGYCCKYCNMNLIK